MAAVTSLIFVGNTHPNDGGLRPKRIIQLEEGSRPSFSILNDRRVIYIPTVENMLDDLIFMIAVQVAKNPLAVDLFDQNLLVSDSEKYNPREIRSIKMYTHFSQKSRRDIYFTVKSITDLPKIVICLFRGSGLSSSVKNISSYSFAYEICESTMGRQCLNFSDEWECW